jgi:tetratricopeptide (TPR) repeat protein
MQTPKAYADRGEEMNEGLGAAIESVSMRHFCLTSLVAALWMISASTATADSANPGITDIEGGIKMINAGQYDQAIRYYDHIISATADPLTIQCAYTNRSDAYAKLRNYPKAQADLDTAIGLSPDDEGAYLKRAALFADQKLNDRAIADYSKALFLLESKDTSYAPAAFRAGIFRGRAKVYKAMGNTELAKRDEDSAASLSNQAPRR